MRKPLQAHLNLRLGEGAEDLNLGSFGSLTEWRVRASLMKYAYKVRQEDVTAHTLRHSFAKNLVDTGTSLDQVAILLGRESCDTTRIYNQLSGRDLERTVLDDQARIIAIHHPPHHLIR